MTGRTSSRRCIRVAAGLVAAALLAAPANADDRDAQRSVPAYGLPDGVAVPALAPRLADAARDAVSRLRDPPGPEDTQEAARLLAGLGPGALPAIVDGLRGAPWYVRAALFSAVAEMDAPEATPLLARAVRDPSFAVRAAAVTGLGKTGAAEGSAVLLELAAPGEEPVWRVRALVAPALRRGALRGTLPREAAERALTAMLLDPDPDVRRAALRATAPLAARTALPHLLAVFGDTGAPREERAVALGALRVYRDRPPELIAALRRGLAETDDPERAAEAGAALLDLAGVEILADPGVARDVLRQLGDAGASQLREALARLGKPGSPWLSGEIRRLAQRIARRKVEHHDTPLEALVEILLRVDRDGAFGVLRELVVGPDAEVLAPETRRFALKKVRLLFAPRLRDELRAQFDSRAGDGVRKLLLEAIEASGGDDLADRLDAALRHPDREARRAALGLLQRRGDLPAGPALRELASSATRDPQDRIEALDVLARRAPEEAADLAIVLLDDERARVREKAIELVAGVEDPEHFETIRRRLDAEDGGNPPPKVAEGGAVTPSGAGARTARERRRERLRGLLLEALCRSGAERARTALLRVLREDPSGVLRETAARLLRRFVVDADAELLLTLHGAERAPRVQDELLRTLATLGGSERARGHFDELVRTPGRRGKALELLRERDSRVMPNGLEGALTSRTWTEEELDAALFVLARAGRTPAAPLLAELVAAATTIELADRALSLLADADDSRATALLVALLTDLDDPRKLAAAIQHVGRVRAEGGLQPLLQLLDGRREAALSASFSTDPELNVYRRTAVALGRLRDERAGRALVRHLLDDRMARLGARLSVPRNGPFKPVGSAPARVVRALVCGLAHFEDAGLRGLVEAELARRAPDGRQLHLDEGYVDGLARYLRDPAAYGLPGRRRPMAALPLQRLVARLAPRLSALDLEMGRLSSSQLEAEGRFEEALQAHATAIAVADVEDAARAPEDRLWERGRTHVLRARERARQGAEEAARAEIAAIRALDPTSGALAYLHAYALIRTGRPNADAESSLRFKLAGDERHGAAHFYLGWVVETHRGPIEARTHYAEAHRLDRKRVEDAGDAYLHHRRGKVHPRALYSFWYGRVLARTDDVDAAAALLASAIRQDDRYAAQALRDPVFSSFEDLDALVADALARIPASD